MAESLVERLVTAVFRAVNRRRVWHKLPLPLDQYANWQTISLTFDPKDLLQ